MHLDAATHEMLLPYLGRKDADAAAYLAAHPLHLNPAQLHELNTAVHNEILFKLHYNFDTQASAYPANLQFWRLPAAVQTVLVSVAVQYGPNLHLPASQGETPAFFTLMKQGRWADAVHELRNFGDSFPTRRAQEANILQAAIDNGEIPASC